MAQQLEMVGTPRKTSRIWWENMAFLHLFLEMVGKTPTKTTQRSGWWLTYPSKNGVKVSMMTFPSEWKVIKFHGSSHHQPEHGWKPLDLFIFFGHGWSLENSGFSLHKMVQSLMLPFFRVPIMLGQSLQQRKTVVRC